MPSPSELFLGIVISVVGLGYFIYGKKQNAVVPMVAGVVLMLIPYFVSNLYAQLISGVVIMVLPYYVRL